MDPATIISTTGAIVGILDVIARTVSTLHSLQERWKNTDLAISTLITQLNSLKAALSKISEWIKADLSTSPQDEQLAIDLQEAVLCCQILVESMDGKLGELKWSAAQSLETQSKMQVFLRDGNFVTFQMYIERQTSALTLLLTACNCKTLSEQKTLLKKSNTRSALQQVRDDSSSLIIPIETSSQMSDGAESANTSKMRQFEVELMSSLVYLRAAKCWFRCSGNQSTFDSDSARPEKSRGSQDQKDQATLSGSKTSNVAHERPDASKSTAGRDHKGKSRERITVLATESESGHERRSGMQSQAEEPSDKGKTVAEFMPAPSNNKRSFDDPLSQEKEEMIYRQINIFAEKDAVVEENPQGHATFYIDGQSNALAFAAKNAQVGEILVVKYASAPQRAHELSLELGSTLKLLRKDDDYADGWYIGRNTKSRSTGLFPGIYTQRLGIMQLETFDNSRKFAQSLLRWGLKKDILPIIDEQFFLVMRQRGWDSLPPIAREELLKWPRKKKFAMVSEDAQIAGAVGVRRCLLEGRRSEALKALTDLADG